MSVENRNAEISHSQAASLSTIESVRLHTYLTWGNVRNFIPDLRRWRTHRQFMLATALAGGGVAAIVYEIVNPQEADADSCNHKVLVTNKANRSTAVALIDGSNGSNLDTKVVNSGSQVMLQKLGINSNTTINGQPAFRDIVSFDGSRAEVATTCGRIALFEIENRVQAIPTARPTIQIPAPTATVTPCPDVGAITNERDQARRERDTALVSRDLVIDDRDRWRWIALAGTVGGLIIGWIIGRFIGNHHHGNAQLQAQLAQEHQGRVIAEQQLQQLQPQVQQLANLQNQLHQTEQQRDAFQQQVQQLQPQVQQLANLQGQFNQEQQARVQAQAQVQQETQNRVAAENQLNQLRQRVQQLKAFLNNAGINATVHGIRSWVNNNL